MAPLLPAFARFGIRRFQAARLRRRRRSRSSTPARRPFDLEPDGHHYFDIHHTAADTLDKIRPEDLRRNAAAIALLAYLLAEQ